MKRQPRWLQQGNCSRLSRLDVNTAETIQMPLICSWESSSQHQSSGPQMVLLAWWGPYKKLACKRKKGLDCIIFLLGKKRFFHTQGLSLFVKLLMLKEQQAEIVEMLSLLLFVLYNWIVSPVGVLAVKERLHWGRRKGCRIRRGTLYSRDCGGLEPGQSQSSLQRVQGLYRWQSCAAGWYPDVVLRVIF